VEGGLWKGIFIRRSNRGPSSSLLKISRFIAIIFVIRGIEERFVVLRFVQFGVSATKRDGLSIRGLDNGINEPELNNVHHNRKYSHNTVIRDIKANFRARK